MTTTRRELSDDDKVGRAIAFMLAKAEHDLGIPNRNISLDAMEEALNTHHRIWGEKPGKTIFYLAALVHTALGIWMLYERRQFRYGAVEATQLVLGLSIPVLIIAHVADARLAHDLFGNEKYYSQLLAFYTMSRPYMLPLQFLVLVGAFLTSRQASAPRARGRSAE